MEVCQTPVDQCEVLEDAHASELVPVLWALQAAAYVSSRLWHGPS